MTSHMFRRLIIPFIAAVSCLGDTSHLAYAGPRQGDIFVANADFHGLSGEPSAIIRVDPLTGDRIVFSDAEHGEGPFFNAVSYLAFENKQTLLAVDPYASAIFRVDLATGDRSILSNMLVDSAPLVVLESEVYVIDPDNLNQTPDRMPRILRLGQSGEAIEISSRLHGTGPEFNLPKGITSDGLGNLYATDPGLSAIFKIDIASGDRIILSDAAHGTGPDLLQPGSITIDAKGDLIVQQNQDILRIDPITGAREQVVAAFPPGPHIDVFQALNSLAIESSGDFLVVDSNLNALLRVDPSTGNRYVLSDGTHGTGRSFEFPVGLAIYVPEPMSAVLLIVGATFLLLTPLCSHRKWLIARRPSRG